MINKQSLWFITLFALILILGIYYVSMPSNTLTVFSGNTEDTSEVITVEESDVIVALKVEEEEKILSQMEDAQNILLDSKKSVEEKNAAYQTLQELNNKKGKVLDIEKKLKEKFSLESCVQIEGNNVTITLSSEDQGSSYANEIISYVSSLFESQMYITVKFK